MSRARYFVVLGRPSEPWLLTGTERSIASAEAWALKASNAEANEAQVIDLRTGRTIRAYREGQEIAIHDLTLTVTIPQSGLDLMWTRSCPSCGWIEFTDEMQGGMPRSLSGGDSCQECEADMESAEWMVADEPHPASLSRGEMR
jgi:hypothetical protein